MLRTRIITALVLLAFLLPAVFASTPWPFAIVSLILIAAAAWEWARLNGVSGIAAIGPGALLALAGAWAVYSGAVGRMPATWWWATLALWVVGSVFVLRGGPSAWPRWPAPLRLLVGLVLLWVGWLALAQARVVSINFVLSVLCIVWMADVGAYAAGRAFGKHKLAPSISPGKSWEGVVWRPRRRDAAGGGLDAVGRPLVAGRCTEPVHAAAQRLRLDRHVRGQCGAGGLERGR